MAELLAAVPTVHTTGINWSSVLTIGGTILGSVGGAARYVVGRVERGRVRERAANEKFVRDLVGTVTRTVDLKLEQVNEHLAEQDRKSERLSLQVADVRERAARIDGRLARRAV